jgi:putative hydrolase of the HAD superfamily
MGEGEEMIQPPIELILYDLGNVILPFNHFQVAEKLSRFSQKKEFQDPSNLFSYLFDFEEGAVNDYEVGKVSSREFFQSLREFLQLSLSFEDFIPIWDEIFVENQQVSQIREMETRPSFQYQPSPLRLRPFKIFYHPSL